MAKKKRDRLDELVDELLKTQSPEEVLSDSGAQKELRCAWWRKLSACDGYGPWTSPAS